MIFSNRKRSFLYLLAIVCTGMFWAAERLVAQEVRYQLGKQVIAFETDFEQVCHESATRKQVIPNLQSAVQSFFQLSLADAEKYIDAARLELTSEAQKDFASTLISLRLTPDSRWYDSTATGISWALKEGYETKKPALPVRLQLSFQNYLLNHPLAIANQEQLIQAVPGVPTPPTSPPSGPGWYIPTDPTSPIGQPSNLYPYPWTEVPPPQNYPYQVLFWPAENYDK